MILAEGTLIPFMRDNKVHLGIIHSVSSYEGLYFVDVIDSTQMYPYATVHLFEIEEGINRLTDLEVCMLGLEYVRHINKGYR